VTLRSLINEVCDEWAVEAKVPAGLADRALQRRTRRLPRTAALVAASAALAAAAGAAFVSVNGGSAARQPVQVTQPALQPVALSNDTTLHTDLGSTFPRHLVAAGHTAVAAYYTGRVKVGADKSRTFVPTWYLYNPASGTYENTPWAYLDVAPGMHQAAVLEGPLPASRVGILDMNTQKVTRWITVGRKVGGVSWAPDGHQLVLTAYTGNPDVVSIATPCVEQSNPNAPTGTGDGTEPPCQITARSGYYIANAETGQVGDFRPLPVDKYNTGGRQDLGWSRSGTLVWAPVVADPQEGINTNQMFYDLDGHVHPAPAHEADVAQPAGLSPDRTLLPTFGPRPGPAVTVTNVKTGKRVAVLPIEEAKAWADDTRLFAVGCDVTKCAGKGEFTNRLLLVTLKGKITPLTGYHRSDEAGSWEPVFTHR
jgi:hypothetical protein